MKDRTVMGITGGIGSGKSTVLKLLEEEFGGRIIQADLVAHELMEPDAANYQAIVREFGRDILAEDGRIDRKRLGSLVFSDKDKLETLNQISHPGVIAEIKRRIRDFRSQGGAPFLAVEAALLIGSGLEEDLDFLCYIYADEEERIRRLMENRGYTLDYCRKVFKKQRSDRSYRDHCHKVIDNSGSPADTLRQIKEVLGL